MTNKSVSMESEQSILSIDVEREEKVVQKYLDAYADTNPTFPDAEELKRLLDGEYQHIVIDSMAHPSYPTSEHNLSTFDQMTLRVGEPTRNPIDKIVDNYFRHMGRKLRPHIPCEDTPRCLP